MAALSAPPTELLGDGGVVDHSNKKLTELPASLRGQQARGAAAVRELNLSFNGLSSLVGLVEACPALERLGASHNRLRSLPELGTLLCLRRVDLSHNQLSDISPLGGCAALSELWLAHNALELTALVPLADAPALRDLVLHANPCLRLCA
jgi:Leucine-rich repeat (LRR) protein